MNRRTNGGGDEGRVGRWTGLRMGVDMRNGWEEGQTYEWGGDEGRVGRWTGVRMGVEMRDGWEDGQAHEWGWI